MAQGSIIYCFDFGTIEIASAHTPGLAMTGSFIFFQLSSQPITCLCERYYDITFHINRDNAKQSVLHNRDCFGHKPGLAMTDFWRLFHPNIMLRNDGLFEAFPPKYHASQ